MFSFLISFLISAALTMLTIRHTKLHGMALDRDLSGVQKVHFKAVPRIGGLSIFIAVVIAAAISAWRLPTLAEWLALLLFCAFIAFFGGIIEDFTGRVSPLRRLLLTMLAAGLAFFLIDARLVHLHWPYFNLILPWVWVSFPLTVLAVAGIANAVNIIDGFNGLASVVTICMLLSLAYVAFQVHDPFILVPALIVAGAITGFLIWNFPAGLIFLGDGGAYFIGFMLGELALLLVMRNPDVSTWYAALLLIYPTFETLFSVYRRVFVRGASPGMPDGIHLHSLIFRRVVQWAVGREDAKALTRRNSLTSPYLWFLSLMAVIPATLFWRHTTVLFLFCLLFVVSYVWLYARIVRFRAPRWLIFRGRK
jgi:UDP-N-acetylmuramyl pentapeptide phosphotransferase/UDP-N-acetylglucosamine-1-phosphate transferase